KKTTPSTGARVAAAKALAGYGARAEKALPALVQLRASVVGTFASEKAVDEAIDRIVLGIGERDKKTKSVADLASEIGHKDADLRLRSVKYFSLIQDATLSRMAKAAADEDEDVRHLASKSVRKAELALRKAPPNVEHLVADLKDEDASVRLRAAKKLGMLGKDAASAVPALTAALKDEDDDVKRVAAEALKLVQKK